MSGDGEPRFVSSDDNRLVSGSNGDVPLDSYPLAVTLTASCVRVQVRPKVEFHSLLQHAGATKDVLTMKEVGSVNLHTYMLCNLQQEPSASTLSDSQNLQPNTSA